MRGTLLSFAAAVVLVLGLVALDSKVTNWFIPEGEDLSAVETDLSTVDTNLGTAEENAAELRARVVQIEVDLGDLETDSRTGGDSAAPALARLAAMWAVGRWSTLRPGEAVAGTDPSVAACLSYVMLGTGSFVECGFERTGLD